MNFFVYYSNHSWTPISMRRLHIAQLKCPVKLYHFMIKCVLVQHWCNSTSQELRMIGHPCRSRLVYIVDVLRRLYQLGSTITTQPIHRLTPNDTICQCARVSMFVRVCNAAGRMPSELWTPLEQRKRNRYFSHSNAHTHGMHAHAAMCRNTRTRRHTHKHTQTRARK